MEVLNLKIDEIKPYENNPRNNLDAVDATANSIKEFGWQQPIVVDKDMVIIAGHTRYLAAKKLGYDTVPVVVASNLSDEQVRAYRLADNKTGELAEWDLVQLDEELESILNIDMEDYGFDIDSIDIDDEETEEELYTQKKNIPQYEINGEQPEITQLYDISKASMLIEEIEGYEVISDEVKHFLTLGAYRHIKFNYAKIAEFYAHQPKEVQRLMEHSALVIIDYDNAIANGYAKFKGEIDKQREKELQSKGVDDDT